MFSPAPISAALLALASLDVLHIGVLFQHYRQNSLFAKSDYPKACSS
ncbi:unknow [Vibrio parahaemolyticus]|nr:unknow [Vibrio parahaemolyticus]